jgi:hypothetical protein
MAGIGRLSGRIIRTHYRFPNHLYINGALRIQNPRRSAHMLGNGFSTLRALG